MTENTETQNQEGVEDKTPAPGSPEYEEAMAAKFRESQSQKKGPDLTGESEEGKPQKPERPENVPEKFWDAEKGVVNTEALLKSYTELESSRQSDDDEGDGKLEISKEDEEKFEQTGLNFDELQNKIVQAGDLEDSDYEALEKVGFSRDFVKQVVGSVKYQREAETAKAVEYIGGEKARDELLGWAAQNLDAATIDAYNAMLNGPEWPAAVDALKAKREASRKTSGEPKLESSHSSPSFSTDGYETREHMKADMRDPLYREAGPKGDAFRQQVARKVANSSWHSA